ncbi:alpha/beta fold hydrolase [Thalassococcus sp. S3]|uniref:alpha/beta fold hydrolase n=1 Tax=Thalassococcus sp. S3 TaxID=2017482 RepID=UPI0010241259|nr:alpha/beta fold hydrolase [Thalassococcus sp. S3]QBF31032.1 alpha/beta hydrolase [Thalassococcus sp. S3]
MLNVIRHGTPTDRPPVLIAHGLFGSARNWNMIAKRLADEREVIAVDMRNHGASPWFETQSYQDMAGDLAEILDRPTDVLGHSMGGKSAMMLALLHPEQVHRMIVADIAPVAYGHSQMQYIDAMRAVDLTQVARRSDAVAQLADLGVAEMEQSFLTQSLDLPEKRWRLNLDTLAAEMPKILSFPQVEAQFERPTLFLSGAASHYVQPEYRPRIKTLFPAARFAKLPGAGHWLHAEKPREFEAAVRTFLNAA